MEDVICEEVEEIAPEEKDVWITRREAARLLCYSPNHLRIVSERLGFSRLCRWKLSGQPYLYLLSEIELCARWFRHRARYRKRHSLNKESPYVEKMSVSDARLCGFLSVKEAAEILQISEGQISQLVKSGKLVGYQNVPGHSGSRLFVSRTQVRNRANDEQRLACRRNYDKGDYSKSGQRKIGTEVRRRKLHPTLSPGVITATEAAQVLGICPSSLAGLRRSGKISGFHHLYGKREGCRHEGKWWYYSQKEIWELLQHEGYREKRRQADAVLEKKRKERSNLVALMSAGLSA